MGSVNFDAKDFLKKIPVLETKMKEQMKKGVDAIANEILRLSQFEVPHDTGLLQNSGHVEPLIAAEEMIVGYNKVYAARLHEHPEYHFQKGRKGKYLENPIKHNLTTFKKYIQDTINAIL